MKNIINYLGALLALVLIGTTFTACSDDDGIGSANVGLGIKTIFPTKVVTNQPLTINGSGFLGATEIVFPGGTTVTDFEVVSDDMIRVNTPSGIPAEGGKVIVRSAEDKAESRQSLTLGHTQVTGYSKQPGESATGGELITVFGTDLEFINSVELLDPDSVPQFIDHTDFYRKGTNNLIFRVPQKNIYKGTFEGKLHTYDGLTFDLPELAYEPAADGGHMEIVKTTIWKNDGSLGDINWSGEYRFGLDGHDSNNECAATFPQEIWDRIKTETFYVTIKGASPQIRVTSGWWSTTWTGDDIFPGNELLEDLGDGVYKLAVTLAGDPLLDYLDEQHLLFTGSGYAVDEIFFETEEWVGGGGDQEVKVPIWTNNGSLGDINWSGEYRFGLDGNDVNNECAATFPQDIWDRIKTETFYVTIKGASPQIRVTSGWWSTTWTGDDIFPGNERLEDLGDGTYKLTVNLAGDPLLDYLDVQHLLFTGSGYSVQEIYFIDIVHVGGGSTPKPVVFWTGDDTKQANWDGVYRFGLDGHDDNNECVATFPEDIWNKIKTGTFYMSFKPVADWYQIRITNGWWDSQWQGSDNDFSPNNMSDRIIDNEDGTFYIEINFGDDPFVGTLDQKHLLFTGSGYSLQKLYFIE